MENTIHKKNSGLPYPLLNPPQTPLREGPFNFLKWLFTMSEEERVRAGIFTNAHKNDLFAASALVIPPADDR